MATQADIDALADKLSTNGPLSWVVADCPVVALFKNSQTKDPDSLGQPLDRNGCGDLLRLWIGMNQDTHELFVTLTIRIRVSPVRKKTRRQGRLLFLVVPSNSLQLKSTVVDYMNLDQQLSQCLFDMPSDTQSAKCKLLHTFIDVGPHVSDVIMPEYQCRSNVMPQAMALLRKLKSLSEASTFQLYTNHETSRQEAIEHVSNILLDGPSMITPAVDIKGFYPGGRSACKNMWLEQGWLEAGDKDITDKESLVQQNQKELQTLFAPQPPPPYEPDAVPDYAPTPPAVAGAPSLPSTIAPVSQQGLSGLPATILVASSAPVHLASDRHDQQCCADTNESVPTTINRPPVHLRHSSPSTPEASLSSGYTATFLSGFSSQSPIRKIRDSLAAKTKAAATERSGPSIQVAASSLGDHAFHNANASTRANTPSDSLSHVPDSANRKRLPSYSVDEDTSSISKRQALFHQSPQTLHFHNLRADFSPTIPDTVSCLDKDKSPTPTNAMSSNEQGDQLTQWLSEAWRHCPTAHYLFITELLKYGTALSGSSQDNIATCHVNCSLALLAHCTKQRLAEEINYVITDCTIDAEIRALIRWLYVLQPGADLHSFSDLLQLSLLSQQLILIPRTGGEYESLVVSSRRQKAKIVSQACINYGAGLLQDDPSNLVSKMLREEERSKI